MQHFIPMTLGIIWGSSAFAVAVLCFIELAQHQRELKSVENLDAEALEKAAQAWQQS